MLKDYDCYERREGFSELNVVVSDHLQEPDSRYAVTSSYLKAVPDLGLEHSIQV